MTDRRENRDILKFNVLIDWDGTLFVQTTPKPGAYNLIKSLNTKKARIGIVTNNSSRKASEYEEILRQEGLWPDDCLILTSGGATARHIKEMLPGKSAFVLGTSSLKEELYEEGITLSEDNPGCVVVGYDTTLTYKSVCQAHKLILAGSPFIATHDDPVCPTDSGSVPDCGAILAFLEKSTNVKPVVVGKPYTGMVHYVKESFGGESITIVIGDKVETDGEFSRALDALLILVNGESRRVSDSSLLTEMKTVPDLYAVSEEVATLLGEGSN